MQSSFSASGLEVPYEKNKAIEFCYDMDGSLLKSISKKEPEKSLFDWLIQERRDLLQDQIRRVKTEKYNTVILSWFTYRADTTIDDILIKESKSQSISAILFMVEV